MISEANFKNLMQNNHLQTSFTAGDALRPRQRMRTLRTGPLQCKAFLKRMSQESHIFVAWRLLDRSPCLQARHLNLETHPPHR